MAFQSFVSESFLKEFTPLNVNIDITELTPHLQSTELVWTRELLGRPLYDDLKLKFSAQTLNSDEIELVGYVKQHIAYRTAEMSLPFLSLKIRSKGVTKLRGEFEDGASLAEVKYLRVECQNRAEYYEKRVIDFLCLNSQLFPLYNQADTKTGIIQNSDSTYDSDIYLGDSNVNIRLTRRLGFFN